MNFHSCSPVLLEVELLNEYLYKQEDQQQTYQHTTKGIKLSDSCHYFT